MKHQLLLVTFLFSLSLASQGLNLDRIEIDSFSCPVDPSTTVYSYKNWSLYQTTDNSWSGEKFNGNCPNLVGTPQSNGVLRYDIDLSSIDPERSLFLAYVGPVMELEKNNTYSLYSFFSPNQDVPIKYGEDCANSMCSGLIIRAVHQDDLYPDSLICDTYYPYTRTNQCDLFPCFNTEKTERNTLVSAIYKLSLEGPSSAIIRPGSVGLEYTGETRIVESNLTVEEQYYNGDSYNLSLSQLLSGWGSYLVTHNVPGLPAETNQSFTEIELEESKADPTAININLEWEVLQFQKYSQIIGALVEGSEPARHPVNLEIASDMCLQIVELIGTDGTCFKMQGGTIDFSDKQACIQVRNNSAIYIEEGHQVYLGRDGVGNVNLRSGGSMIIKKDAELIFGGKLILTPYRPYSGNAQIHVDLQGGGHLEFTEDAKIINNVFGDELFLYVYMNGGTINLSKLSAEDKAKVILVYPKTKTLSKDFKVFPNPTQDLITIYNTKQKIIKKVELYNLQGQLVYLKDISHSNPTIELDLGELESGLYNIKVDHGTEQGVYRIIIE